MRIHISFTHGDTPVSPRERKRKPANKSRKLLLTLLVIGAVGTALGLGTYAVFTATTDNAGNSFAAGTVAISDNDLGSAMLSLANAKPTDSDTACIKITYTGSLDSTVRLYGTITGTLPTYLTLTVTRGTDSSPSFDSCVNFTADGTNYLGLGNGVVYQGALSAYPATYAAGIVDPKPATPETWSTSEAHSYKYTITLDDNNAAQGLSGGASFTWEARNL
jgi:hypothetical protein